MYFINTENIPKLLTKEDTFHIHKILGIITTGHVLYRYYLMIFYWDAQIKNNIDIFLLSLQGILSITSLIFHIPAVRNRTGPMLNPQIRIQSIIFSLRSFFACFSFYYLNNKNAMILNIILCFLTMIFTDISTNYYDKSMQLMRTMPYSQHTSDNVKKIVTLSHSNMQLGATLAVCTTFESSYCVLTVIQYAAFLTTLVRKNIIDANIWHFVYTILLKLSYISVATFTPGLMITYAIMHHSISTIRFTHNINKYISWSIILPLYYIIRYNTPFIQLIDTYIQVLPFHQYYVIWIMTYNFMYDVLFIYKQLYLTK